MILFLLAFAGVIGAGAELYTLADWLLNRNASIVGAYGAGVAELQAQPDKMAYAREDASSLGRGNTIF